MGRIRIEEARLRVEVDDETGALCAVEHCAAGLSLIAVPDLAAAHPFMVIMVDGAIVRRWLSCTVRQTSHQSVQIQWVLAQGLLIDASLSLDAASGGLRMLCRLGNPQQVPVAALAYPYLAGIGRLGAAPENDAIIHPYATGFMVRDPLTSLPSVSTESTGDQPFVLGLYPEGFSGSTMQFMAYSSAGRGGFYVGAEDGACHEKWLNWYRHADGYLRMAVWHAATDQGAHRDVQLSYTTVLEALDGGSWYDAADRYKAWAVSQPWAANGPLWSREDRPQWLFERVGLCTFGINARSDRAPWLAAIDGVAGTPVLHLLGVNWPRTEANYRNGLPGGLADWFPARFDEANMALIRANGDYLVPFEFDLLFGSGAEKADAEQGMAALQVIPTPTLSRDAYHFPFLCPACAYSQSLHAARDRALAEQYGVDGIYYDISVNNVRHTCYAHQHDHAPGDAGAVTAAFKTLLAETQRAMREARGGKTIPQGTEMVNEQLIPYIWFYQARAEASPAAPFEAGPLRDLIKQGKAEKIPLFSYLYHEYGPLRLDGWAKLSREQGDLVYYILGRVFMQGGLIELNYEFSALEDLDGSHDVPEEHYYLFDDDHFSIDPELARYVGRLARSRIGRANRYLAYGEMRRPAPLAVVGEPTVNLEYFHYNCPRDQRGYREHGTLAVPAVLQTAWRFRDDSYAWMLLNIDGQDRQIQLDLVPPAWGGQAPMGARLLRIDEDVPSEDLGSLDQRRLLALTLPSRRPVLIEARLTGAPEGNHRGKDQE